MMNPDQVCNHSPLPTFHSLHTHLVTMPARYAASDLRLTMTCSPPPLLEQPPVILRVELLQNIPVEGVELEPYVLVQYANGQSRQVCPIPSRIDF